MVMTVAPTQVSAPAPPPAGRRASYLRRRTAINYALLAPALLLSVVIVVVPGILKLLFAFTDWSGVGFDPHFVGGQNFRDILADPVFATALTNNLSGW